MPYPSQCHPPHASDPIWDPKQISKRRWGIVCFCFLGFGSDIAVGMFLSDEESNVIPAWRRTLSVRDRLRLRQQENLKCEPKRLQPIILRDIDDKCQELMNKRTHRRIRCVARHVPWYVRKVFQLKFFTQHRVPAQ